MPELYFDENAIGRALERAVGTGSARMLGEALAESFMEALQEKVEVRLSRDRLAAMAMQGWLAATPPDSDAPTPEGVAAYAYRVADAMIAERNKGTPR